MSTHKVLPRLRPNIVIAQIEEKEPTLEFTDEVSEGLECFLFLLIIGDVCLLLVLTIALLISISLLSPVGIIFITPWLNHYWKKLQR